MNDTPFVLRLYVPAQPEQALSPNASRRVPRGMVTRLKTEQRDAWRGAAIDAAQAIGDGPSASDPIVFPTGPVRCRITVLRGGGRRPWDQDNLLAACKWGLDQLQGVVVTDDRQLVFEPVVQERAPDGIGRTLVELWQESDREEAN